MPLDDMLDDRQAQPGAAGIAAARGIDPIEALGQARQMFWRDAFAGVAHRQQCPAVIARRA